MGLRNIRYTANKPLALGILTKFPDLTIPEVNPPLAPNSSLVVKLGLAFRIINTHTLKPWVSNK